jgi:SAM-dependent methyltransferase
VAEEYERVRSGYPAALVDRACELAGLQSGDTVLEIGAGTGKLTRELVARGLAVEAVEPDEELAAVARTVLPDAPVRFHTATFEAVELPAASFPAVFAGTSFHWVDPTVGWAKVAAVLLTGGVFALMSGVGGVRDEVDEALVRAWHAASPRGPSWEPVDDATLWREATARMGNVSELWAWLSRHEQLAVPEAAELFRDVELAQEEVGRAFTVEEYLALVRTTNSYLHLSPEGRHRLEQNLAGVIERHGGTYHDRSYTVLVTARRT